MLVCESERRREGGCQNSPQGWMSTSSNMPPSRTVLVAPQLHLNSPQKRGGRVTPSRFTSLSCWMTFRYYGEYIRPRSYIKISHYSFPCTHSWQPQQSFFTAHKGLIHQLLIEIWRIAIFEIEGYFIIVGDKLALSHVPLSLRVWCVNKAWSQANITALFLNSLSQKLRLEINHVMPEIHSPEPKEQKWVWANF